jgi:uncharacterized YccA/Bax inhibitor family protein
MPVIVILNTAVTVYVLVQMTHALAMKGMLGGSVGGITIFQLNRTTIIDIETSQVQGMPIQLR